MRPALMALLSCWVAGCHATVELDPRGMDAGGDAASGDAHGAMPDSDAVAPLDASCARLGDGCGASIDCCSRLCGAAGVCEALGCQKIGEPCTGSGECCSGQCLSGLCEAIAGCVPAGEACTSSATCCSRVCAVGTGGEPVCQRIGGCVVVGEICRGDADCCGGAAGACESLDVAAGIGRCGAMSGCAAAGEICRVADDPTADRDCCPGGAAGRPLCRATTIPGIQRCVTELGGTACVVDGSACATPDECCGGTCALGPVGLVCRSSCGMPGESCTRAADCCGGDCANDGTCAGVSACAPLTAECVTAAECCTGTCDAAGRCAPP